jgi:threonine/homoserine/homoserine lactone efflux protein
MWKQGFLTNVLNPKATLFFLTIFTSIVSADTPLAVNVLYALYISLSTGLWFCYLSYLVSQPKIRVLLQNSQWFDRAMGVVLVVLAFRIVFSS